MTESIFVTHEAKETKEIGKKFAEKLRGGDVVALYGELGSGKTTFVQGLAKGLGVRRRIISPTFIIVRRYEFKAQSARLAPLASQGAAKRAKLFYHVDLYRIEDEGNLQGLGLEEIIGDKNAIVAIEWAEKLGRLLPKNRWDIWFEFLDEGKRRVAISNGRGDSQGN